MIELTNLESPLLTEPHPKTLGACADLLFTIRKQRLELQRHIDLLTAKESELKAHIIGSLPDEDASGVSGMVARVTITTKSVAQVKDWEKFYEFVQTTGEFDLMQKRVSDAAVKERWEAGDSVPGVEPYSFKTLSINKV